MILRVNDESVGGCSSVGRHNEGRLIGGWFCTSEIHKGPSEADFRFPVAVQPWGTAVTQWLRRCATNRKVVVSIPAGVSGFFPLT